MAQCSVRAREHAQQRFRGDLSRAGISQLRMGVGKDLDSLATRRQRVRDRKTNRVALDLEQALRNKAGGKSADEDAAGPIAR
jgi:hypothetical protein